MNINLVIIVGRAVRKPELQKTTSGVSVAKMSIATSNIYTDKQGNKKEDSEFHNVVFWGRTAEIASTWIEKGQLISIQGRLTTRSWDDKDGKKRYATEIIAEKMQLGPKPGNSKHEVVNDFYHVDEPSSEDIPL